MDINILESPIFLFDKYPLEDEKDLTKAELYEKEWIDSYGFSRKIQMSCNIRLPRQMEMDVMYGLVELFIQQLSPISYNTDNEEYCINSNRVYFSLYGLLNHMGKEITGPNAENLKKSIRILRHTNYMSMKNGVFYDKEKNKYIIDNENGFSLITKYSFESKKKVKNNENIAEINELNWVEFDSLIINNIKKGFFKYLNHDIYYSIPTGLTRRLYAYLERHRYNNGKLVTKIRRKYITLADKIPLDYKYLSEVKKRIKRCEKKLKQIGFITDVDYQKEFVDYYFIGIKEDYVPEQDQENEEEKPKTYLRPISDNLISELVKRGVGNRASKRIIAGKNKWEIKKIIMFVDKQLWSGKIKKNMSGLLRTAIEGNFNVDYETDIVEYIEKLKNEEKEKVENADKNYNEYIAAEIEKFKNKNKDLYNLFKDQSYNEIKSNPGNILGIEKNRKDFEENGYDSELVQNKLTATIKLHLGLNSKQEFLTSKTG